MACAAIILHRTEAEGQAEMTTAIIHDDPAPKLVRPLNSNAWLSVEDRAESLAFRLTPNQMEALAKDTRLPARSGVVMATAPLSSSGCRKRPGG